MDSGNQAFDVPESILAATEQELWPWVIESITDSGMSDVFTPNQEVEALLNSIDESAPKDVAENLDVKGRIYAVWNEVRGRFPHDQSNIPFSQLAWIAWCVRFGLDFDKNPVKRLLSRRQLQERLKSYDRHRQFPVEIERGPEKLLSPPKSGDTVSVDDISHAHTNKGHGSEPEFGLAEISTSLQAFRQEHSETLLRLQRLVDQSTGLKRQEYDQAQFAEVLTDLEDVLAANRCCLTFQDQPVKLAIKGDQFEMIGLAGVSVATAYEYPELRIREISNDAEWISILLMKESVTTQDDSTSISRPHKKASSKESKKVESMPLIQLKEIANSETAELRPSLQQINALLDKISEQRIKSHTEVQEYVSSLREIIRRGPFDLLLAKKILNLEAGTHVAVSSEKSSTKYPEGRMIVYPVGQPDASKRRVTYFPLRVATPGA